MQIVYTPTLPPGCCFICKASIRDSYIDTQVSKDYEGAYYICNMCIGEMATMYSYLSFDEYKDLRSVKEELERQNFELIKRLGELDAIRGALARAGFKYDGADSVVMLGGYSNAPNDPREIGESEQRVSLGVGEGAPAESSDDSDVAGLHANESKSDSEFALDF